MNTTKKKAIGLITLATSCLAFATLAAENGLVAHFTFDDATKFGYDSVQKKVIGEITNDGYDPKNYANPTFCDAPIVRGMKTAQGWGASNYMTVPGTSFGSAQGIPYGDQAFTWSLWICPATTWAAGTGLGTTGIYLLRHAVNGHEWRDAEDHMCFWLVKGDGDRPKYTVSVGSSATAKAAVYQHTDALDGKWHFLAATYSNRVLTLYFDGQQVARTELANKVAIPDNTPLILSTAIGTDYNLMAQRRYVGSFDDIKVYNRALGSDEVLAAYQAGATAYDTDVLEWDGAAAGGAVEDAGNWSTKSTRRTAGEVYAAGNVAFDVTALEEGGTLTHDTATTLKLKGVVCSNGQDEVTLQMKQGTLALSHPSTQRGLVAHFTFDDPAQFGYDSVQQASIGTIVNNAIMNVEPANPISCEAIVRKGLQVANGWWQNNYMTVPGTSFGSAQGIPYNDQAVTYSVWFKPATAWQDANRAYGMGTACNFLRHAANGHEWYGNYDHECIWICKGDNDNPKITFSIGASATANAAVYQLPAPFDGGWHLLTATYADAVLTLFYDGEQVAQRQLEGVKAAVPNNTPLILGAVCDGTGANGSGFTDYCQHRYAGSVDELKVFNVALTADEVKAEYEKRSQTLDSFPGTVPSPVNVQLDAGTTATVCGYDNEYASLVGSGSASVSPVSSLKLDGTYALAGALTGGGAVTVANLVLGGDTSAYTGDFTVGENATITAAALSGLTAVSTFGGKVVLPAKATVVLPTDVELGKYALVKAGTLVPPADFSQWTATIGGEAPIGKVKFVVDGNTLFCRYSGGMTVIIR